MSAPADITEIANAAANNSSSIFSLLSTSDLISKSVIMVLLFASLYSWAIIIDKIVRLRKVNVRIAFFEKLFWSGKVLEQLYEQAKTDIDNPLTAVFVSAMRECKRHDSSKSTLSDTLKVSHKERILQSMYLARNRELESLEKNLGFLATVGSSALLIGLFGTVLGILHSFPLALAQNAPIGVVAKGIAESLVATAIGLFASIPAVVFYNYLSSQIIRVNNKVDDFIGELSTILSRAIDEGKL